MLPAIFVGYDQRAGGGWSGDLMVLDMEELMSNDCDSKLFHSRRIPTSDVFVEQVKGQFAFPVQDPNFSQPAYKVNGTITNAKKYARPRQYIMEKPEEDQGNRDDLNDGEKAQEDSDDLNEDEWLIVEGQLARIHETPRLNSFEPEQVELSIPLEFLDAMRKTTTDLPDLVESEVRDHWPDAGGRSKVELSGPGTGKTIFTIMPRKPRRPGYEVIQGQEIRCQKTNRTHDTLPDEWRT